MSAVVAPPKGMDTAKPATALAPIAGEGQSEARVAGPRAAAQRHDGWTPERRAAFLAAIAEGHSVEAACGHVGLSRTSAYARRRADRGFALGWSAAGLLAREAMADMLTSRAIHGQVDTYTRADGETITRHRLDNRLGQAMLARLDRIAERPLPAQSAELLDARAVAGAFEAYLALVGEAAEPAAIDAFVGAQTVRTRQLCQLEGKDGAGGEPVWWHKSLQKWVTSLAPPDGFRGRTVGEYGDSDYWRTLTRKEADIADERFAARQEAGGRQRDAWFGFVAE